MVGSSLKLFYGAIGSSPNKLVNIAYDTMFVSGATGIRSSAGMAFDNFTTDNITLKAPNALPFTDDFSTAVNGDQLFGDAAQLTPPNERNWQDQAGDFIVSGGKAQGNTTAISFATVAGNIADGAAEADLVVDPLANQQAGVVVRSNAAGMYYGQIVSTGSGFVAKIFKLNAAGGVIAQLGSTSAPLSGGAGVVRLEAAGPSLKLFFTPTAGSETLVSYGFDTAFTTGMVGIRASKGATTAIDSFTTKAITLTAPTSPPPAFVDDFSTPNNGNQLSLNWTERQGNFTVTGSQLVANDAGTGLNVATLNGISLADASVQADLVAGTANQNVGLIARYQANGNYYVALIASNAAQTVFTPYILKFVNGAVHADRDDERYAGRRT